MLCLCDLWHARVVVDCDISVTSWQDGMIRLQEALSVFQSLSYAHDEPLHGRRLLMCHHLESPVSMTSQVDPLGDLNTAAERALGALVKEKYGTDFYILYRFPQVRSTCMGPLCVMEIANGFWVMYRLAQVCTCELSVQDGRLKSDYRL